MPANRNRHGAARARERGRPRGAARLGRGFTLLELMIAIAILAPITLLIYGAFAGMKHEQGRPSRVSDRYREGRLALARITRELQSAYLSQHMPHRPGAQAVRRRRSSARAARRPIAWISTRFANRRLDRDAHESDQIEISLLRRRPTRSTSGMIDLVRRDERRARSSSPTQGRSRRGARRPTSICSTSNTSIRLTGQWTETWDTTPGRPASRTACRCRCGSSWC